MHLYTSNRLDVLLDRLAERIASDPLPPFTQELIVVQSQGMERWLAMGLAVRLGIWAHAAYPFPREIVWRLYRACLPYLPDTSAFDPAVLRWRLMRLLPQHCAEPAFQPLAHYLHQDHDAARLFQLSQQIADTFDQYLVYRPDLIAAWDAGEGEDWQALLWRSLRQDRALAPNQQHPAALHQAFLAAVRDPQRACPTLPTRLHIFGISALPPFYIDIFSALSARCEVNLLVMNPCQVYWGDILSDTEIARRTFLAQAAPFDSAQGTEGKEAADDQYYTRGNPLLASMGKLGRDFLDLLNECGADDHEHFVPPHEGQLLGCLQSDIFYLQDRGRDGTPLFTLAADDDSLQIHNCHSPLREVEVLYDRLLALLERHADLCPGDILVMTPNIETYAPLIQAVFDTTPDPARRIPFSIADRTLRSGSRINETFLALLDLPRSRLTLAEVLDLLETDALRQQFALDSGDIERLRHWLTQAGVRWGYDAADRSALDLPAFADHSWSFGLERLLLGYALPGAGHRLFAGILPIDDIEGGQSLLLGALLRFLEQVFALRLRLQSAHTPDAWALLLDELLHTFFLADLHSQPDLRHLRKNLADFVQHTQLAAYTEPLSVVLVHRWFARQLETQTQPTGFITGKVTFCALLPMRSIPFPVVCLLGMNDRVYPRAHKAPGFDYISAQPRRGDRSRRHDDRYLFLEALLSARHYFYVSYVGQSIRDNSPIPPSVLVSELLAYLDQGFVWEDTAKPAGQALVLQHPLHAFSPVYFNGEVARLYSYAEEYCASSQALLGTRQARPSFLPAPLPPAENEWRQIALPQFIRFFLNPCAFLLQQRLGVSLDSSSVLADAHEPLTLAGLERYQLDQQGVAARLDGQDSDAYYPLARAAGWLPPGQVGACLYQQRSLVIEDFAALITSYQQGKPLPALQAQIKLDRCSRSLRLRSGSKVKSRSLSGAEGSEAEGPDNGWTLQGRLDGLYSNGLLQYRAAQLKTKDLLRAWLSHLFLNALATPGYPRDTWLLGLKSAYHFDPVPHAELLLQQYAELYWLGLHQPLRFFPDTARAYAESLQSGEDAHEALRNAQKTWASEWSSCEADDPYFAQCFGTAGTEVLNAEFEHLALTVFEPLLQAMQTIKT